MQVNEEIRDEEILLVDENGPIGVRSAEEGMQIAIQRTELKEVKLSVRIDVGDLNTKCKQTREFISAGNKVKVSVKFRGRELQHTELGFDVLDNFCNLCKEFAEKDGAPALEGRQVSVVLVQKGSKLLDKSKLAVKNKKDDSNLS